MPQNENFWNPYRMVPVREQVHRAAPASWERIRATHQSGSLTGRLENLTPLFIGDHNRNFLVSKQDNKPQIPGSSLKGAIRSLAELVGGGCSIIGSGLPSPQAACSVYASLCITCRMFGMMERQAHAKVHKGRVSFGDARLVEGRGELVPMDVYLGNPKTTHQSFYRTPQSDRFDKRCRKLYFHQPEHQDRLALPTGLAARSKWTVRALPRGHAFEFTVAFADLAPDELALLLYVLALEEDATVSIPHRPNETPLTLQGPLCHKIGYAKPLGGGSCRITLQEMRLLPSPEQRYGTLSEGAAQVLTGAALNEEIIQRTRVYREDHGPTMTQLRKMLVWDERDTRAFHYPSYEWFRTEGKGQVVLKPL